MPDSLTLTDNRTGRTFELPIKDGTVRAADLRKVRTGPDDFGLVSYDPALVNTAACRSRITYIDGDKGILRYRGYPIEQLAEKSSYLETAYLLLQGELPTASQLQDVDQGRSRQSGAAGAASPGSSTRWPRIRTRWAR